jgi:hypothetical protein
MWVYGGSRLCLLLVDKAPDRLTRAALRWHGRYCREIRDVDFTELRPSPRRWGS